MLWAEALGWTYVALIPFAWVLLFSAVRRGCSLPLTWAFTSLLAVVWLPFLIQLRRWVKRHPAPEIDRSWTDQVERELGTLWGQFPHGSAEL